LRPIDLVAGQQEVYVESGPGKGVDRDGESPTDGKLDPARLERHHQSAEFVEQIRHAAAGWRGAG
jgi:hypothetical protein